MHAYESATNASAAAKRKENGAKKDDKKNKSGTNADKINFFMALIITGFRRVILPIVR